MRTQTVQTPECLRPFLENPRDRQAVEILASHRFAKSVGELTRAEAEHIEAKLRDTHAPLQKALTEQSERARIAGGEPLEAVLGDRAPGRSKPAPLRKAVVPSPAPSIPESAGQAVARAIYKSAGQAVPEALVVPAVPVKLAAAASGVRELLKAALPFGKRKGKGQPDEDADADPSGKDDSDQQGDGEDEDGDEAADDDEDPAAAGKPKAKPSRNPKDPPYDPRESSDAQAA